MDTELMGIEELSRLINAEHLSFSDRLNGFSSVSIDSRSVKSGSLFFAFEGKLNDGHSFVEDAFKAGAAAAVVESSKLQKFNLVDIAKKYFKDLIIVESSLNGLQDAAAAYIKKFPELKKIAITGSSGKTTTKEITASIISCEKNTMMSRGNYNSEIGLPLSIFDIRADHEVGVFEIGMNKKGEISKSAQILKPNIAAITNIGSSHIGNIGSKSEIVYEKKCIFDYLTDSDTALIPKNDEFSNEIAKGVKGKVKFYAKDIFSELGETHSLGLEGTEFYWVNEKIKFPLPGKYCFDDAITAIAIAKEIPVGKSAIKNGLEAVKPVFARNEFLKGRTALYRDCYNANPESTAASVELCDSIDWNGRRIYIIADMLELGNYSKAAHNKLGAILAESKADMIFLFGNEIKEAQVVLNGKKLFFYTDDINELSKAVDRYVQTDDFVLLKGSRGCGLERLTDILLGGNNAA